MLVWHNTGLSLFIHILSMLISIGLIKQHELKSSFEGLIGFLVSYITIPVSFFKSIQKQKEGNATISFMLSFIKLGVLPIILFSLFFIIYRNASPKFEELTHSFAVWFSDLFKDLSIGRFIFILFGLSLVSLMFLNRQLPFNLSSQRRTN